MLILNVHLLGIFGQHLIVSFLSYACHTSDPTLKLSLPGAFRKTLATDVKPEQMKACVEGELVDHQQVIVPYR